MHEAPGRALPLPRGKTRNDILNVLKRADGLTADQLAMRLHITPMAVRKQLAALERDGLIVSTIDRRPIGRPAHVYHLTDTSEVLFPKQYDTIMVEFLADLAAIDGPEKIDFLFTRRADRTFAYLEQRAAAATTFDERVAAVAEGMDSLGYLATWEKIGPDTFQVTQHNCVIQRVATTYPAACECEMDIYCRLLDAEIERTAHIASGDHMCCYVIRPRASSQAAQQTTR